MGDREQALDSLRSAVNGGLTSADEILFGVAFLPYLQDPEFRAVLSEIDPERGRAPESLLLLPPRTGPRVIRSGPAPGDSRPAHRFLNAIESVGNNRRTGRCCSSVTFARLVPARPGGVCADGSTSSQGRSGSGRIAACSADPPLTDAVQLVIALPGSPLLSPFRMAFVLALVSAVLSTIDTALARIACELVALTESRSTRERSSVSAT